MYNVGWIAFLKGKVCFVLARLGTGAPRYMAALVVPS